MQKKFNIADHYRLAMESQMVQNSRNKIGLTFNKIVIKVKTDFNQAQQNPFTFNRFSLKVKTFRIKLNKIDQNNVVTFKKLPFKGKRYFESSSKDHVRYFQREIYLNFTLRFISIPDSLSRLNNLTFQGQAANAVNNPDTLSTTMPSAVNKVVNRYFVYC